MWFGTISFKSAAGEGLVGHGAGGNPRIGREFARRKELKQQIGDAPPVLERVVFDTRDAFSRETAGNKSATKIARQKYSCTANSA